MRIRCKGKCAKDRDSSKKKDKYKEIHKKKAI